MPGPTWFSWFSFPFFAPLSGAVSQEIAPSVYAGIPEIESDVIQHVASYGKQLGILSEAIVELADRGHRELLGEAAGPADGPALNRLRKLVADINDVKQRHRRAALTDAERALDRLKTIDPNAHQELKARFSSANP